MFTYWSYTHNHRVTTQCVCIDLFCIPHISACVWVNNVNMCYNCICLSFPKIQILKKKETYFILYKKKIKIITEKINKWIPPSEFSKPLNPIIQIPTQVIFFIHTLTRMHMQYMWYYKWTVANNQKFHNFTLIYI